MSILNYIKTNRKIFLSLTMFLGLFVTDRTVNFFSLKAKTDLKEALIYKAEVNYRRADARYERSFVYTGSRGGSYMEMSLLGTMKRAIEYIKYISEFNFRNASVRDISDFYHCLASLEKIDEGVFSIFYRGKTVRKLKHIIEMSKYNNSSPLLRYKVFYKIYLAPLYNTYIAP